MTDVSFRRRGSYVAQEILPDPRTLVLMGQDLMARTLSCFASQGVVPPDRHLVYMAPVPADCEQVVVLFSGWEPMPPWDGLTHCDNYRWVADFSIAVTRCTPAIIGKGKTAPTTDQMFKAAEIASADAEVLICVISSLDEIGPTVQILTPAPQGGMQTVELTVQVPAVGGLE